MRAVIWVLCVAACSGGGKGDTVSDSDASSDTGTGTDTDTDSVDDTATEGDTSGDADTGSDSGPSCPVSGDGRIDLAARTIDGVALASDLEFYEAVFGALDCQQPSLGEWFVCTDATGGFSVTFPDQNADGIRDTSDYIDLNIAGVDRAAGSLRRHDGGWPGSRCAPGVL